MRFQGRVAIVTGAAGGIGSATARILARDGADLCLADCNSLSQVSAEIRSTGRRFLEQPLEMRDTRSIRAMVDRTTETFGRLDILVNVAGITSLGSAEGLTEEEWDRVLNINLKGVSSVASPLSVQCVARNTDASSTLDPSWERTAAIRDRG